MDALLRERLEDRPQIVDTILDRAEAGDYRFSELAFNRAYGTPVHRQIEITANAEWDTVVAAMQSSLGLIPTTQAEEPNST